MRESNFLEELQKRAIDQKTLFGNGFASKIFQVISAFLGNHPWRLLIPLSLIISLLSYAIWGKGYVTLILKIFGGFH